MAFTYISSPYTHLDPKVMEERLEALEHYAYQLTIRGCIVYSPILHFHNLAKKFNLPKDAAFWNKHNVALLKAATQLNVLKLPGWDSSVGVIKEIDLATTLCLPIYYSTP